MDCLSGCGRILIIILNIIFLLVGLVVFALGMVLKFGFEKIQPYLDSLLEKVKDVIKELQNSSGSLPTGVAFPTNIDFSELDNLIKMAEDILKDIAIILIIIGAVLLVIVLLGLCGACYKIKIFLFVYSTVLFIIMAAMVTVTALYLNKRDLIDDKVKPVLKTSIKDSYGGLTGTDFISLGWNFVMGQFSCCGVDSNDDFNHCVNWKPNAAVRGMTVKTPLICCKELPTTANVDCAKNPTVDNSNFKTGCYDKLWSYVVKYNKYVMTVVIISTLIQAAIIFFGCWIACKDGKSKVGHLDN